jgi:hypothetical protein
MAGTKPLISTKFIFASPPANVGLVFQQSNQSASIKL